MRSRLTNCNVSRLTVDRVCDWTEVYNQSHRSFHNYTPLEERELTGLINKGRVQMRDMLIAYDGRIPLAACRTTSDDDSLASTFICDLSCVPGDHNGHQALIEYVIDNARRRHVPLVSLWISEEAETQGSVVASFSFDVLEVRTRMEHFMLERPDSESTGSASGIKCPSDYPSLEESLLRGKTDLQEFIEITRKRWKPSLCVPLSDDDGAIVAYTSNASRNQGWLMVQSRNHKAALPTSVQREEVLAALAAMFDRGVRRVRTEISPEYDLKRVFSDDGFQANSTFYLMGLELLY